MTALQHIFVCEHCNVCTRAALHQPSQQFSLNSIQSALFIQSLAPSILIDRYLCQQRSLTREKYTRYDIPENDASLALYCYSRAKVRTSQLFWSNSNPSTSDFHAGSWPQFKNSRVMQLRLPGQINYGLGCHANAVTCLVNFVEAS